MKPLDGETFDRVHRILRAAAAHGADPVEALHGARLIRGPRQVLDDRRDAARDLLTRFCAFTAVEMGRRDPEGLTTAAGMHRAILGFLEDAVREVDKW